MHFENSSAVTVSGEDDTGFVHALQVESVSVAGNEPTLSQIIVRLPDSVGNSSELKLKVTLRGGVIRIALPYRAGPHSRPAAFLNHRCCSINPDHGFGA